MPSIELKVDTTQAKSNVDSLKRSMDGYIGSVQELASQGKYTEAAQEIQQMAGQASQSLMQQTGVKQGATGPAAALLGNTNNQELRTLDARLASVSRTIEELTKQLESSTKSGEYKNSADIASSLNSAEQERARLEREKLLEESGGKDKKESGGLSSYFRMKEFSQAMDFAFQGLGIQATYRQNVARGNYEEAEINKTKSKGDLAGNAMSAIGGAMMLIPGAQLAGGVTLLLGQALKGAFDLWGANKEANMAEYNAYQSMLPYTHGLNKLYASGNEGVETNRERSREIIKESVRYAEGTNLNITDFLASAREAAKYGYLNAEGAMQMTRNAGIFAYGTGADLGSVQSLMGTVHRYGKEDVSADTLNRERVVSGLARSQTGEFLSSLQKVIEAGISEGYIRSTEDVAKTFSMFNTLTGGKNEFWKGEQGASRIMRMGEGISSATELNDVNDMLTFEAAQNVLGNMSDEQRANIGANTGSYVDTMLLMERGLDTNMFKEIAETVNAMEGGNAAAQIERFRSIYNLNYTGAAEVYRMSQKGLEEGWSDKDFAQKMQEIQEKPEYQSEEKQRTEVINEIQKSVALIGGDHHSEVMGALNKIAGEYGEKAETHEKVRTMKGGEIGKNEVPDYMRNLINESLGAFEDGSDAQTLAKILIGTDDSIGFNGAYTEDRILKKIYGYAMQDDNNVSGQELIDAIGALSSHMQEIREATSGFFKDYNGLKNILEEVLGSINVTQN